MGYLIWFDPERHPSRAAEFVLFFRGQKLVLQKGPPGLFLEALQGCRWCWPKDGCRRCPLDGWELGEPPWTPVTKEEWVIQIEDGKKGELVSRRVKEHFQVRKWSHGAPPEWFLVEEFTSWPEGGNPEYLLPVLRANVFLLTGRPDDSPPSLWPGDPRLRQLVQRPSWREPMRFSPAQRYKRLMLLLAQKYWEEGESDLPCELYAVVDIAHSHFHPFPDPWLAAHDYSGPMPAFCFHAGDTWAAALIELAWAVRHDVYARSCCVPDCGTWFFLAGRQWARKQLCTHHRRHGGAQRIWRKRLREQYPEAWKVREALRNLRARLRRGTISARDYERMAQECRDRLKWFRATGLAPERRRKSR